MIDLLKSEIVEGVTMYGERIKIRRFVHIDRGNAFWVRWKWDIYSKPQFSNNCWVHFGETSDPRLVHEWLCEFHEY